jgi:hypothetical protein
MGTVLTITRVNTFVQLLLVMEMFFGAALLLLLEALKRIYPDRSILKMLGDKLDSRDICLPPFTTSPLVSRETFLSENLLNLPNLHLGGEEQLTNAN